MKHSAIDGYVFSIHDRESNVFAQALRSTSALLTKFEGSMSIFPSRHRVYCLQLFVDIANVMCRSQEVNKLDCAGIISPSLGRLKHLGRMEGYL